MAFRLYISTGNAAFDGDQTEEIGRILRRLADTIAGDEGDSFSETSIRDINGNTVGHWTLDPREDD